VDDVSVEVEIVDAWRVVDRWWTETPAERYFVVLQAGDAPRVAVCWDTEKREWSLKPEEVTT
jgi:hypothetical protein